MKMNIVLEGTQMEMTEIISTILQSSKTVNLVTSQDANLYIKPSGSLEPDDVEERDYWDAFERVSWEIIYLAHLVLVYKEGEDSRGEYISMDKLLSIDIGNGVNLSQRQISARVGGAKRVTKSFNIDSMMDFARTKSSMTKRIYIFRSCIEQLHRFLEESDATYRQWMESEGLTFPAN